MAKEITELSLEERGKLANDEIRAILKKYNLVIQPQVEKADLDTFVSSLKVRMIDTPKEVVQEDAE